jgi:hypothetical protein
MKWFKIAVNNFNRILGLLITLAALHFMKKTIFQVLEFNLYSGETKQFMMTSSYGLSVLGICICCGVMFIAGAFFWNGKSN